MPDLPGSLAAYKSTEALLGYGDEDLLRMCRWKGEEKIEVSTLFPGMLTTRGRLAFPSSSGQWANQCLM